MSKMSKFALNLLLYLLDLAMFWGLIITGIMRAMGKTTTVVPILFLIAFIAVTVILVAFEFHYAIDEEDLMGSSDDKSVNNNSEYDYDKLVDDDVDSAGKEYYAKLYREYQSEHAEKQDDIK